MNRTVSFSLVALLLLILSSCATNYYQVATVKPISDIRKEGDRLVYEDQNCRIEYNFWCQGGDPGFSVFNKTDKDLFIHKDRCFYVFNGYANNYYKGKESNDGITKSASSDISSASNSLIPPHATKVFDQYRILEEPFVSDKLKNYPSKKQEATVRFTQSESPVNFSNIIAYSLDESDEALTQINNKFYIASFSNYPDSRLTKEGIEVVGSTKNKKDVVLSCTAPDRFWNLIGRREYVNFATSLSGGVGPGELEVAYNGTLTAGISFMERGLYIGLGYAGYKGSGPTDSYCTEEIIRDEHGRKIGTSASCTLYYSNLASADGLALQGTWNIMSTKLTPVLDLKLIAGNGLGAVLGAGVKYRFTKKFGLALMAEGAYLSSNSYAAFAPYVNLGLSYGF